MISMKCFIKLSTLCVCGMAVLSSCAGNDSDQSKNTLEDLISAAKEGDYDCARKYCRGALRDQDLIDRIKIATVANVYSEAAVANGENDTAEEFIEARMKHFYGRNTNAQIIMWSSIEKIGDVTDYPAHGDVCKLINVVAKGKNRRVVLSKIDGNWYVTLFYTPSIDEKLDNVLFEKIWKSATQEYFNDKRIYDLDLKLTGEALLDYINTAQ